MATDAVNSVLIPQLWESDGTEAGTIPFLELPQVNGVGTIGTINSLVPVDTILFFSGPTGVVNGGQQLWRTNGTATGSFKIEVRATILLMHQLIFLLWAIPAFLLPNT